MEGKREGGGREGGGERKKLKSAYVPGSDDAAGDHGARESSVSSVEGPILQKKGWSTLDLRNFHSRLIVPENACGTFGCPTPFQGYSPNTKRST